MLSRKWAFVCCAPMPWSWRKLVRVMEEISPPAIHSGGSHNEAKVGGRSACLFFPEKLVRKYSSETPSRLPWCGSARGVSGSASKHQRIWRLSAKNSRPENERRPIRPRTRHPSPGWGLPSERSTGGRSDLRIKKYLCGFLVAESCGRVMWQSHSGRCYSGRSVDRVRSRGETVSSLGIVPLSNP